MSVGTEFSVLLEIKSNGSRLVSGWTPFVFVLTGQEFVPFLPSDRTTPRGCLKVAGCQAAKLPPDLSDGKKYAFKLASDSTAYVFNASNEITRERVITLLNFASACANWFNPYSLTATVELSEDANEVSKIFFSSLHSKVAARRLQGFFFRIRSKNRVARLLSQYPEIYLVSVNTVEGFDAPKDIYAYISGLVVKPDPEKLDIFNQPHKTTAPVCTASTPQITTASAFHVAVAAHTGALSYLSVSLFPSEQKEQKEQESIGIAFVPLSDVPRRRWQIAYTPYTATLPLEPYLVPDLTVVSNPKPLATGPTAPPTGPLTALGHLGVPACASLDDGASVASTAPYRDLESASNVGTEADSALPTPPAHGQSAPPVPAAEQSPAPETGVSTLLRGASLQHAVSGNVNVTVFTPAPAYTMCGWLLKKSDTWMIGGSYRPYWFVLMNGEFQYFQQMPHATVLSLDQPKKLIQCQNITAVTHKNGVISVHFKQRGAKGVWHLKSDPDHRPPAASQHASPIMSAATTPAASPHATSKTLRTTEPLHPLPPVTSAMVERMWVRKLIRCSPNIPDPDLKAAADKLLYPLSSVSSRNVSSKVHSPNGVPHEIVRVYSKERRPSSIKIG